jgi:hypothetical protein
MQGTEDLTHRDWVLYTQKALFLSIDKNISASIQDFPNGKKKLIVSGISEDTIEKLAFLTNTDQNNNYLYLEDFGVNIFGFPEPLNIPGLLDIALALFRDSDLDNFLEGSKTKIPFTGNNITSNSGITINSFSEFIDILTNTIPYSTKTYGKVKYFELVLNPDAAVRFDPYGRT